LVTPVIFAILCLAALYAYKYDLPAVIGKNATAILVAPFNPVEDLSKVYGSVLDGVLSNYAAVAVVLFLNEIYLRYFSTSLKRITPMSAFLSGVCASYILSVIMLVATGKPSGGTSIIGFTVTGLILVGLLLDFKAWWLKACHYFRTGKLFGVYVYVVLPVVALYSATLFFLSYLWMNGSWWIHIAGGLIFSGLMVCYAVSKKARIG